MKTNNKTGNVAWVTGASKGIGFAVTKQLVSEGWTVAATARSKLNLDQLDDHNKRKSICYFACDITNSEDTKDTINQIEEKLGPINLAILNAGTYTPMTAETFSISVTRQLIETNLMGTVNCLEPIIKRFITRQRGHIAIVGSMAGYRGLPTSSAYGASKAGLINMCEALRPELTRFGIRLQLINPGFVKTPLTDKNTFPMPFLISAETAAKEITSGLKTTKFEITFPWQFTILMKIFSAIPDFIFFKLTKGLISK